MRAGVGIHVQQRFLIATLLNGAGGGQPGLLGAGVNRHTGGNAVGQIERQHGGFLLSLNRISEQNDGKQREDTGEKRGWNR